MKLQSLFCLLALPCTADAKTSGIVSILEVCKALDYRYFIAGGTCAAFSHGITTPLDVVKTKIQANPRKYNKGMASAAIEIVKQDGPGVLLGGLGPTVIGYGIEGAMKFGVYEIMKPVFVQMLNVQSGDNKALAFTLASVVAGAVAALLLCPMESARIKMVTDDNYKGKSTLQALSIIANEDGVGSMFASIWAMLSKQIPYTFGKQVSFDVFASMMYKLYRDFEDKLLMDEVQIKWAVSVTAAFLASLVACIFSQPGDMVLTETYRPAANVKNSNKFPHVVKRLYEDGGMARFFTGTGARIVHVSSIITSQLVVYDMVKQLLGLPATGSH